MARSAALHQHLWARLFPLIPILLRRHAHIELEVFAKEGLGGEVELYGDFFDAHVGGFEELARFVDDHAHYPLQGRHARFLFDDGGEVAGGEALLLGIEGDVALVVEMGEEEDDEVLEDHLLLVLQQGMDGLIDEIDVEELEDDGLANGFDQLEGEAFLLGSGHDMGFGLDALLEVDELRMEKLVLLGGETDAGVFAEEEHALYIHHTLNDGDDIVDIDGDDQTLCIVAHSAQADEGGRHVDVDGTGGDGVRLGLVAHLYYALGAEEGATLLEIEKNVSAAFGLSRYFV